MGGCTSQKSTSTSIKKQKQEPNLNDDHDLIMNNQLQPPPHQRRKGTTTTEVCFTLPTRDYTFSVQDMFQLASSRFSKSYTVIGRAIAKGLVYKVQHNVSGVIRAVKVIANENSEKQRTLLMDDVSLLQKLDHPNIVKVYEFYENDKYFYIVMEYCEGVQLKTAQSIFTEKECAWIMFQVLCALNYLHNQHVVHGDVSAKNILFYDYNTNIKLIDLGLSSKQVIHQQVIYENLQYMAPEIINDRYTSKSDVWSCGVLIYKLLTGSYPFQGQDFQTIYRNIHKSHLNLDNPILSTDARNLLSTIFHHHSKERPTAKQCLSYRWFQLTNLQRQIDLDVKQQILTNVITYKANSKFQSSIFMFHICTFITSHDLQQISQIFRNIDFQNNGWLSHSDFQREIKLMNNSIQIGIDFFQQLDLNNNGRIEYSEFLLGAADKQRYVTKTNVKKVFSLLDKDSDGFLTFKNLQLSFPNITHQMFDEVDLTKDGKVQDYAIQYLCKQLSYKEFKRVLFVKHETLNI